jgi:hypothetical protein
MGRSRLIVCLLACAAVSAAHADLRFQTVATGAQEVPNPGVDSQGTARAVAVFDVGLTKVGVVVHIENLDNVTAAHFHCGRAGENGPVAYGLISPGMCELQRGQIRCVLTNADANLAADCVTAIGKPVNNVASLRAAMASGDIYLNVHTSDFPSGEVRGQMRAWGRPLAFPHGDGDPVFRSNDPDAMGGPEPDAELDAEETDRKRHGR